MKRILPLSLMAIRADARPVSAGDGSDAWKKLTALSALGEVALACSGIAPMEMRDCIGLPRFIRAALAAS